MIRKILLLSLLSLVCTNILTMDDQKNIELKQVAYFFQRYTHARRTGIIFYDKDREPIGLSLSFLPNTLGTLEEHAGNNIFLADNIAEANFFLGFYTSIAPYYSEN